MASKEIILKTFNCVFKLKILKGKLNKIIKTKI
jgi:hypothetical protein